MSTRRRDLGAAGEAAVARWYESAGYRVIDRNWRCRDGELDLVVARGSTVVFCEVKTRSSTKFGTPAEAVTWRKQQRLRALALRWLDTHPGRGRRPRFDVASVMRSPAGELAVEVLEARVLKPRDLQQWRDEREEGAGMGKHLVLAVFTATAVALPAAVAETGAAQTSVPGVASFCGAAKKLAKKNEQVFGSTGNAEAIKDIDDLKSAFRRILKDVRSTARQAPSELEGAFELLIPYYESVPDEPERFLDLVNNKRLRRASAKISRYGEKECGIERSTG